MSWYWPQPTFSTSPAFLAFWMRATWGYSLPGRNFTNHSATRCKYTSMACDRFVYFDKGKRPSKKEVGHALEDFLGAFMVSNEWGGGRWTAKLVGNNSWPLRRVVDMENEFFQRTAKSYEEQATWERWIEVFIDSDNIDVMTRSHDEATNALAEGFARLLARFWKGRLEDD